MTCTLCWQWTIQFRLKLNFRTLYDFDLNETIDIYYFMYCRLEFLYFIIHECELFDRLQNIWYKSTHSCMCKYLDWWLFWSKNLDVTGPAVQFSKWGADPPILRCRGRGGVHRRKMSTHALQKMTRDPFRVMSLAPRRKCPWNVVQMKEAMVAFLTACKRSKIILVKVLTY